MFDAKLPNVSSAAGAGGRVRQPFVDFILSLPPSQRPKTAAYPSLDNPFASPIADAMQAQFEAAGIQTVYKEIYPPETTDLTPIIEKVAKANPDMVVAGTQSEDAYAQVKAMVQANFNPKFLFFANGANSPTEFPDKVGADNTEGIFSCGDWFPNSTANGNPRSWRPTRRSTGRCVRHRLDLRRGYSVGQLIEAVANKTGSIDNQKIIDTLHSGSWPTLEGDLSWDQYGSPQEEMLVEWIDGKLLPVYPPDIALHDPVYPKPNWGG
jgi:branched-chain amino acid transport system substrate-binding protein